MALCSMHVTTHVHAWQSATCASLSIPYSALTCQEAVRRWAEVGEGGRIAAIKEAFAMTMPAICRCCLGDVFKDRAEVEALSESHHKCWREMEVHVRVERMCVCVCAHVYICCMYIVSALLIAGNFHQRKIFVCFTSMSKGKNLTRRYIIW